MKSLLRWIAVGVMGFLLISFPRGYLPKPLQSQTMSVIPTFTWAQWGAQIGSLLHRVFTFSFGTGIDLRPIVPLVLSEFGPSLSIVGWGMLFVLIFGVTKGVYDGLHRERRFALVSSGVQWIVESLPEFFVIIALEFLFFYLDRNHVITLYIVGGRHLVMGTLVPALVLSLAPMMYMSRMVRSKVEEQYGQQYLVTATAKGLPRSRVLLRHLVPNLFPTVFHTTVPVMGLLFSNLVVVEFLTARRGIVSGILDAVGTTNYTPVWEGPRPPTHFIYTPFDSGRIFAYALGMVVIFIVFMVVVRFALRLLGFRNQVNNRYADSFETSDRFPSVPWQLWVGGMTVLLLLLLGIFSAHLGLPSPLATDSIHIGNGQLSVPPFPPSLHHLLGTDSAGHDLLSETLHALFPTYLYVTAVVLVIVALSLLLALGATLWNVGVLRFIIFLWSSLTTIFPPMILALFILVTPEVQYLGVHIGSAFIRWSVAHRVIYLGVIGFVELGRCAYQLQMSLDDMEQKMYIEAAIVTGNSPLTRLVLHHWRRLRLVVLEQGVVLFSRVLLIIATLGFLSVPMDGYWYLSQARGLVPVWLYQISQNDWSGLLASSISEFLQQGTVWSVFAPVVLITLTIFSMNMIHTGIRLRSRVAPRRRRASAKVTVTHGYNA